MKRDNTERLSAANIAPALADSRMPEHPDLPHLAPRIAVMDDVGMSIEAWWPKLRQQSRDYLMENNGDEVPADLVEEIIGVGGIISADAWWVGQSGPAGLYLSDEANDWIDEVANGETPEPRTEDRGPTS